jgi:hypothetical protein
MMMFKRSLVILLPMLLLVVQGCAQHPDRVVRTQEQYQLFVRDARLGLTKALLENDKDSIRYWRDVEVYDESRRSIRTKRLVDHRSRTLLSFYLGDAHTLLDEIVRGDHYFQPFEWKPLTDVVTYRFSDSWALWTDYILDQVERADLPFFEIDLLTVYWMKVLNDVHAHSYGIGYSLHEINSRANALLEAAPEHRLAPFIREHIRWEYEESRHELGLSAGLGATLFTGDLTPLIDPGLLFHGRFEYLLSRLQVFLDLDYRIAPAAGQFLLDTLSLAAGDRIAWFGASAGGGVVLFDGRRGRVTLSAGIQALNIMRPVQDTTYTSGFFFQPVGTLAFDLKIGRNRESATGWRGPLHDWHYRERRVHGLRLLLGYTPGSLAPGMRDQGGMIIGTIGYMTHTRVPVRIR